MTPKKGIVRQPVYRLNDGSPILSMGAGFTMKESLFIFWYTYPGSEAFMNAGRAAVRAGYKKKSAVWQGYRLRQKPRIAEKIKGLLELLNEQLNEMILQIVCLNRERMFFDIKDFYRPCKRTVKIYGVEQEIDSIEVIPLDEISERNRMCIDAIDIKTTCGKDEFWYKLPDRNKAYDTLMKLYKMLMPEKNAGEPNWEEAADIIRGNAGPPIT